MKKKNILILFIVLMLVFAVYSGKMTFLSAQPVQEKQAKTETSKQIPKPMDILIKTYHLKFIKPIELLAVAKFYILDSTSYEDTVTVRIRRGNIPKFEEIMKKLDIEKKTVLFKVFTVFASKEQEKQENEVIENKGLKKVLDELRNLWNFKSYKIDGPSFLTVKEDSGLSFVRLVSTISNFNMHIFHVKVRGEKPGKRIVSIGQIQLKWTAPFDNNEQTLISTDNVTLKEKGYLVAGISGFRSGKKSNALILVINTEIK